MHTPILFSMSRLTRAALALTLLAGAVPALAQNALGTGRGLERDLRVGGTGNFPGPSFMAEVRARNALVTGNSGSGRSLQINAGYTAPDDFRGSLGTDDLFSFRRDSIGSAPGYRGTQGLQYQSAFTIGNAARRDTVITRLDSYGAGGDLPNAGFRPRASAVPGDRTRLNNPNAFNQQGETSDLLTPGAYTPTPVGTLRSTGAFTSTSGLAPAVVGFRQTEQGSSRITASSLMGVRQTSDDPARADERLTARERSERAPDTRANSAAGPDMGLRAPSTSAAQPAFRTSYDDLRARLESATTEPDKANDKANDKATDTPRSPAGRKIGEPDPKPQSRIPEWERRIMELRQGLEGRAAPDGDSTTLQPPAPTDQKNPDGTPADPKEATDNTLPKGLLKGMDPQTMALIKKSGGETSSYSSGSPGSLFDVHVRTGEDAMGKGQYFDAEERFARALSMRPGDVTVMAARLNAQLGAGLYLSAAVNLRQLLEQHPEVIGMRYVGGTMPPAARTSRLAAELRENIANARAASRAVPEDSALLLAYVGFQTREQAAVREGLDALASTPSGPNDPLLTVLRKVWVDEGKAK